MNHQAASNLRFPDGAAVSAAPAVADPGPGPSSRPDRCLSVRASALTRIDSGDRDLQPQPCRAATSKKNDRFAALQRLAVNARRRCRRAEGALAEQRLLTREADHRVANGLQLVHCTLSLHAAAASDEAAREAIRAAARSVAAAAEAHRHLHASRAHGPAGEATSDAEVYLRALMRNLSPTGSGDEIAPTRMVTLRAAPEGARAVAAGLLPRLGLVTAELVTNALKHGTGSVLVELRPGTKEEGGGAVVAVRDEGAGFPPRFDPATSERGSLGMRLITALARPGRVWVDAEDRRRILVQLLDRPTG
jgi:two-component sensor histidine kinase